MQAETSEVNALINQILPLLQKKVAELARCTPEEVGTGNVEEVGLDSRPMLLVVPFIEKKLGYEKLLKRQDIAPEVLTNLLVLAERLARRVIERKE